MTALPPLDWEQQMLALRNERDSLGVYWEQKMQKLEAENRDLLEVARAAEKLDLAPGTAPHRRKTKALWDSLELALSKPSVRALLDKEKP